MSDPKKQTQKLCSCDGALCKCHRSPSTFDAYQKSMRGEYAKSDLTACLCIVVCIVVIAALVLVAARVLL
jgi:hypothetical protein